MRLKNILIVVKDIEVSRKFYTELFGLSIVLKQEGNVILTEGLVLQDKDIWEKAIGKPVLKCVRNTLTYRMWTRLMRSLPPIGRTNSQDYRYKHPMRA